MNNTIVYAEEPNNFKEPVTVELLVRAWGSNVCDMEGLVNGTNFLGGECDRGGPLVSMTFRQTFKESVMARCVGDSTPPLVLCPSLPFPPSSFCGLASFLCLSRWVARPLFAR